MSSHGVNLKCSHVVSRGESNKHKHMGLVGFIVSRGAGLKPGGSGDGGSGPDGAPNRGFVFEGFSFLLLKYILRCKILGSLFQF